MTLILPWPPRELSPNGRTHWSKKSRVARNYRRTCQLLAFEAGMKAPPGQIRLILEFVPPDRRRRDDDNLIAAFKAGRDGLADALRVDDHRFVTTFSVSHECTPGGAVRVSIAGGSQC